MSSEGRLEARVWTRSRLAELCGITEEQVVEWALLMGNDYTEGMLLGGLGETRRVNGRPQKVHLFEHKSRYLVCCTGTRVP